LSNTPLWLDLVKVNVDHTGEVIGFLFHGIHFLNFLLRSLVLKRWSVGLQGADSLGSSMLEVR
jgi:hypothetical protein